MLTLKQINVLDYLCNYSKRFPISLDFYMDKVTSSDCEDIILLASDQGNACGMAFTCRKDHVFTIYLISVHPDFLHQSIDKFLLSQCIQIAEKSGAVSVDYYYSCFQQQPHQNEILQKGFREKSHTVQYEISITATNRKKWTDFMQRRGQKILQRLTARGFCTKTLQAVPSSVLDKIDSQIGTQFSAGLDPKDCKDILEELSFITLYQNEPVAFFITSAKSKGREIRVEQLSVQSKFHNRGVFLLSLSSLANRTMPENASIITFVVNCENEAMVRLAEGFLTFPDMRKLQNYVYYYKIQ